MQVDITPSSVGASMQVDITPSSVGARPLRLKGGNTYTFSLKTTVSISSYKFVCLKYTNGEAKNIVFANIDFVNFVPERDVENVGFILYETVVGDKVYDVQLEMGSKATSYEPYREQLLTLPTPTGLPGIPVTSGGNYTDPQGQQWVCDEVDLERGVKVQRVYKVDVDGENAKFVQAGDYANLVPRGMPIALYNQGQKIYAISTFTNLSWFYNTVNGQFLYLIAANLSDQLNASCKKQLGKVYYALATPIETPLTPDEIAAYKALTAYGPDTVVQAGDGAGIKLGYQRDVNIAIKKLEDAVASMT